MNEVGKPLELNDELLRGRSVWLRGFITPEVAQYIVNSLLLLEARDSQKEIRLYIDSKGGIVGWGLTVYNTIKMIKAPVTGVVIDQAHSMAAIILQACDKRIVAKNSSILIHTISQTREISLKNLLEEEKLQEELKRLREDFIKDQNRIEEIIVLRTGKSSAEVKSKCLEDKPMNSKEALKFGLIDEIVE